MSQDASFELSKSPIQRFFFHLLRGDPVGSKHYAKGKDMSKTGLKVIFLDLSYAYKCQVKRNSRIRFFMHNHTAVRTGGGS